MNSSLATIGFFDGVHLGHRYVLQQLCLQAHEKGMRSLVITFRQHPQLVITGTPVPLLTTPAERYEMLMQCGVDEVVMLDFADVRHLTAARFMQYLREKYSVRILMLGYNHRFGSDRLTDFGDYVTAGNTAGVEVMKLRELPEVAADDGQSATGHECKMSAGMVAPAAVRGEHVSSTIIRQCLINGDILTANRLLGYGYIFSGTVVHGRAMGRKIGFPTANIRLSDPDKLIPKDGVYAAVCYLPSHSSLLTSHSSIINYQLSILNSQISSLVNIGTNPTVGGAERTIEAHLLDFEGDIYGSDIRCSLVRRIRDERRFDSLEDLQKQITEDMQKVR